MLFSRITECFRKKFYRSDAALSRLAPADYVQRTLIRERARADRTGESLCVVAFDFPQNKERQESLALLAAILESRLRTTDELGWLATDVICAILPNTPEEGAWNLTEQVCQRLDKNLHPRTTIYTYPQESNSSDHDTEERGCQSSDPVSLGLSTLFLQPLPRWKRGLDIVVSSLGLLCCLPLFLLIAIAIKLTSQGPILFRQWRAGLGGRPFSIYKFRTMTTGAERQQHSLRAFSEQDGPAFKMRNDPRLTWLGRFLRKTSLDELPQLWNVLKGEMTLVGPRPLPCGEAAKCVGWQRQRQEVMPGLTCFWQVRGRSQVSFADWMRMDVQYIRSQSFLQDLKLLILTIPAVLFRRGAC